MTSIAQATSKMKLKDNGQQIDDSEITLQQTGILAFPAELRNAIYELVLLRDDDIVIQPDGRCITPGLLRTCRQIRGEARKIFYRNENIRLRVDWFSMDGLSAFMAMAPIDELKHVRAFTVSFNAQDYKRFAPIAHADGGFTTMFGTLGCFGKSVKNPDTDNDLFRRGCGKAGQQCAQVLNQVLSQGVPGPSIVFRTIPYVGLPCSARRHEIATRVFLDTKNSIRYTNPREVGVICFVDEKCAGPDYIW